ncbi:MAG: hypothetical protein LUF26_03170 [Firmicutes bacterium]|nr:hypothetical protein [Bacillota bacterium]
MGNFIGGIGAAFIMAAAAAIIAKFFAEINVIKDKDAPKRSAKVSLAAVAVGGAYLFVIALMFNALKGSTNFFDFETLFDFFGTGSVIEACSDFHIGSAFGGIMMPLYPALVHAAGLIVFEKYTLIAEFVSFVSACVSACLLYSMLEKRIGAEKSADVMLIAACLPCAFMLFAPTCVSPALALILCALYALSKGSARAFIISAAAACLVSKVGIAAFLLYPLYKRGVCGAVVGFLKSGAFTDNETLKKIILTLLVMINGVIICCLIRGI